jgi:hypothetical protein
VVDFVLHGRAKSVQKYSDNPYVQSNFFHFLWQRVRLAITSGSLVYMLHEKSAITIVTCNSFGEVTCVSLANEEGERNTTT